MKISKHKVALIHFILRNEDSEVLENTKNGDPLGYIHGMGILVPGLEEELEDKTAGDSFTVTLPPEKAFGLYYENRKQKLPIANFGDNPVEIGMQFHADTPEGTQVITVIDIDNGIVTVDGNHDLAGETLTFDVEVIKVRDATQEELDHGHVHGIGGHHH